MTGDEQSLQETADGAIPEITPIHFNYAQFSTQPATSNHSKFESCSIMCTQNILSGVSKLSKVFLFFVKGKELRMDGRIPKITHTIFPFSTQHATFNHSKFKSCSIMCTQNTIVKA